MAIASTVNALPSSGATLIVDACNISVGVPSSRSASRSLFVAAMTTRTVPSPAGSGNATGASSANLTPLGEKATPGST